MRRTLLFTLFVLACIGIALVTLLKEAPPPSTASPEPAASATPSQPAWLQHPLTTLGEETLTLGDFKGKLLLVNFWASWCPPCLAEIPELVQAQNDFGDKGFQVVGILFQDRADTASLKAFVQRKRINYPVIKDDPGKIQQLSQEMGGVFALPMSLLIDRDGKIVKTHTGQLHYRDLENWLKPRL
ncbi:Redoxin domain protein [Magnetococcus marinus MC-1]|uniref:Redoxin domain protein n=1 Tax=Magnetococcus marinus (strain ATCC BAA-1437 / JCM 17883 / MC-1) TaxID=156889 RepID=A0L477_MAGMM|nr:TlpA disulfide reductase family protein [Magnetococcus marinus]ABK42770.1 Redoxin domain protein [Magnetococcus marinus MC-1]